MYNIIFTLTFVPCFVSGILNDFGTDLTKRYTVEEVVAYAMQQYPAQLGTYSFTNFVVAVLIAEQVTGRPITELVQEYIFIPMNFTSTVLLDRSSENIQPDPAATPYAGIGCVEEFDEFGFPGLENGSDMTLIPRGVAMAGTAGAVNSNIYDLLAWAKSGTGDDLLSPETVVKRHDYKSYLGALLYGIAQYVIADSVMSDPQFGLEHFKGWAGHSGGAFGFTTYSGFPQCRTGCKLCNWY